MNILTFDIEEWYHFDIFSKEKTWLDYPPRINLYLPQVLDSLDEKGIKATFFCLGWIARIYPNGVREICDRGHEIACHTDKHLFVCNMTPEIFRDDLKIAINSLENITGKKVKSFRAPAFTITESSKWAFEVLSEFGIENDCSIFPASRSYGGFPSFKRAMPSIISYNGINIREFPINTSRLMGQYFVYSGGGYFRLFPYWLIKLLLSRADYAMTYLHMRDFDYQQPRFHYFTLERTFKSYYGLKNAYSKFQHLIEDFEWINVEKATHVIDWTKVPIIKL